MAIISKEKYDQNKIDKIGRYLEFYNQMGDPIDYEILVDGFKAVRRTNDTSFFGLYQNFVNQDTQSIEVLLYNGKSNNNDKRIFYFSEPTKYEGCNDDKTLQDRLNKLLQENELVELRNENRSLRKEVAELESEIARWKKRYGIESPDRRSPLYFIE